jgi:hypothetical protein
MRKYVFLLPLLLITQFVFAQATWVEPKNPDVNKKIRIYCDLSKATATTADKMKADPIGPYYIWTWKPTEAERADTLANGTGDKAWKNSNDRLMMIKDDTKGANVWYYEMIPVQFYNCDAAKVYSDGISFLVKPKDGGGYGDPDVKTEDFSVTIDPPKTDRGVIYPIPATVYSDQLTSIIYDNPVEKKISMQNLKAGDVYVWINATIKDTASGKIRTYAPNTLFSVQDNPKLMMKKDSNGKFRLSIIPNQFFGITSKEIITQIDAIVRKKDYLGTDDRSDTQAKILIGCP